MGKVGEAVDWTQNYNNNEKSHKQSSYNLVNKLHNSIIQPSNLAAPRVSILELSEQSCKETIAQQVRVVNEAKFWFAHMPESGIDFTLALFNVPIKLFKGTQTIFTIVYDTLGPRRLKQALGCRINGRYRFPQVRIPSRSVERRDYGGRIWPNDQN
ncbi:hypothetical protein EYZ11_011207 [Aspergillus tanneri]|uniref:Uncharacterized protein n=1 Tax=Aspergillus tanneri TaxID=1220188 RepID=A0A4S3J3F4_9EURO|nr:hypothetical protein EYZ11_011207 [Aspergillus tanneri]